MIDRILERLEELKVDSSCNDCPYVETCDKVQETATSKTDLCGATMKALAIQTVQEVAKEYANMWIQVSERLPEPFKRVLVYDALDDSITIEHLQENGSFIDSVVAWMPLPIAPYQKGE